MSKSIIKQKIGIETYAVSFAIGKVKVATGSLPLSIEAI
jgi:hypothetical protein